MKALYVKYEMLSRGKMILFGAERNSEINYLNLLILEHIFHRQTKAQRSQVLSPRSHSY